MIALPISWQHPVTCTWMGVLDHGIATCIARLIKTHVPKYTATQCFYVPSPCLTSSRNTLAEPSSCPPILFVFLPGFLWKGVHRLRSKCRLFLPQILTPIPGKGTKVRMNTDQEDGFLQWRWQSEPNGERPPSTGKELFPFSKEKAMMCSEVSELLA